jgi:hypothetical protein
VLLVAASGGLASNLNAGPVDFIEHSPPPAKGKSWYPAVASGTGMINASQGLTGRHRRSADGGIEEVALVQAEVVRDFVIESLADLGFQ